ncbi:MAG: hypothetical protein AAF108_00335 [Planctomycetota bacterium]
MLKAHDGVRLGAALLTPEPDQPVYGATITLGPDRSKPIAAWAKSCREHARRGSIVLALRARGQPGSTLDTGDLASRDGGWLRHGLESGFDPRGGTTGWVFADAAADLIGACLAVRRLLAERGVPGAPIGLWGRCVHAATAVIAAARLEGRLAVDRLVLTNPSAAVWPWRLKNPHRGHGEAVRRFINDHPEHAATARHVVSLFDAAIHARSVLCPALVNLAVADGRVPGHTQFAVFNALGTPRARRWRYVVETGHSDESPADVRRHAFFSRIAGDFLDYRTRPEAAMEPYLSVLAGGEPSGAPAQAGLFADDAETGNGPGPGKIDGALVAAYEREGRTLDSLPYTDAFERVVEDVSGPGVSMTRRDALHRLHNLRKSGRLPRLGRATDAPPRIEPEEEAWLAERVRAAVGSLGRRDALPYTDRFDAIVAAFNELTGRGLGPHSVWRLIAKLAK